MSRTGAEVTESVLPVLKASPEAPSEPWMLRGVQHPSLLLGSRKAFRRRGLEKVVLAELGLWVGHPVHDVLL